MPKTSVSSGAGVAGVQNEARAIVGDEPAIWTARPRGQRSWSPKVAVRVLERLGLAVTVGFASATQNISPLLGDWMIRPVVNRASASVTV